MARRSLIFFVLICSSLFSSGQKTAVPDTFYLYYLGGQSNMEGYGYNRDLPTDLKALKDVPIFQGNTAGDGVRNGGEGIWESLRAGHGAGFSSDGKLNKLSDRFGIELSFAARMTELYPGRKIALIKYSKGGTSIDSLGAAGFGCWEPDFRSLNGIDQYDHFLTTLRNAFSARDINGDGREDILIPCGIVWMQGESDATFNEEVALQYYSNLKRLMDLMRAALRTDDLPVVIGKISDSGNDPNDGKVWNYGELIQYAQEKFARTDPAAAIVRDTRYYKYSDPWHYDSKGFIDLGRKFAEAAYRLERKATGANK